VRLSVIISVSLFCKERIMKNIMMSDFTSFLIRIDSLSAENCLFTLKLPPIFFISIAKTVKLSDPCNHFLLISTIQSLITIRNFGCNWNFDYYFREELPILLDSVGACPLMLPEATPLPSKYLQVWITTVSFFFLDTLRISGAMPFAYIGRSEF